MMDALDGVSVVVVSHNEGGLLRQTVDSVLAGTSSLAEVVVVDDASSDGSADFLGADPSYRAVRLISLPASVGISAARNAGARATRGDVIVFSDAHVNVHPGWDRPLAEALADPEVGEVAPAVGYFDGRDGFGYGFTWKEPSMRMKWLPATDVPTDVPFICGCFLAVRREVFEATGGFDEGMYRWGFEDAELSLRLWLAGYRCQVVPESKVGHQFRKRFPYEVDWSGVMYNGLRMAAVHLDTPAVERVVQHFSGRAAFGRAWSRLVASDTWDRRRSLVTERQRGVREFLETMEVGGVR